MKMHSYQNAFEWREMLQGHLVLRGNAYNRIVSNARSEITQLNPMLAFDAGEYAGDCKRARAVRRG